MNNYLTTSNLVIYLMEASHNEAYCVYVCILDLRKYFGSTNINILIRNIFDTWWESAITGIIY